MASIPNAGSNGAEGDLFTLLEKISPNRESENKLMNVFSSIPLGIMTLDEKGVIEDTLLHLPVVYLFGSQLISGNSFREVVFTPIEKV